MSNRRKRGRLSRSGDFDRVYRENPARALALVGALIVPSAFFTPLRFSTHSEALFVLFDIEAVFIFPWATRLEAYGTFGAVEMGIFIVVLALGLLYAWRKGVLRWI